MHRTYMRNHVHFIKTNNITNKNITNEKMLSMKRNNIVLQRTKSYVKKKIPLFHPFKSTAPYLSFVKVHFSGSDKKWSSPSCSSSSLAWGGRMFSIRSMEWDAIHSTREKSAENWRCMMSLNYPLLHSFIDFTRLDRLYKLQNMFTGVQIILFILAVLHWKCCLIENNKTLITLHCFITSWHFQVKEVLSIMWILSKFIPRK